MKERETVCSERKMQRFPFRKGNKRVCWNSFPSSTEQPSLKERQRKRNKKGEGRRGHYLKKRDRTINVGPPRTSRIPLPYQMSPLILTLR